MLNPDTPINARLSVWPQRVVIRFDGACRKDVRRAPALPAAVGAAGPACRLTGDQLGALRDDIQLLLIVYGRLIQSAPEADMKAEFACDAEACAGWLGWLDAAGAAGVEGETVDSLRSWMLGEGDAAALVLRLVEYLLPSVRRSAEAAGGDLDDVSAFARRLEARARRRWPSLSAGLDPAAVAMERDAARNRLAAAPVQNPA
jgi:hypothetical protein